MKNNINIHDYVRKNIRELTPYSSARDEYTGEIGVFLDANEHPLGTYNRYPDPQQRKLKKAIAAVKNIPAENIFLGNGSDEAIDLSVRIFCEPGIHRILIFPPTFGVFTVAANLNNVELVKLPLNEDFQINRDALPELLNDPLLRMVFICTPNNPTGNCLRRADINFILDHFNGIVVIDEAYGDFSGQPSYKEKLAEYPNLVVMQTFSKAWALAGVRIGMVFASAEIVHYFNKVKMPYNLSLPNQEAAMEKLADLPAFEKSLQEILAQKEQLRQSLLKCRSIKKVFPSDANFFLVEVEDAAAVYGFLLAKQVIVRNQHKAVPNCLRITVGTAPENQLLINALKQMENEA